MCNRPHFYVERPDCRVPAKSPGRSNHGSHFGTGEHRQGQSPTTLEVLHQVFGQHIHSLTGAGPLFGLSCAVRATPGLHTSATARTSCGKSSGGWLMCPKLRCFFSRVPSKVMVSDPFGSGPLLGSYAASDRVLSQDSWAVEGLPIMNRAVDSQCASQGTLIRGRTRQLDVSLRCILMKRSS